MKSIISKYTLIILFLFSHYSCDRSSCDTVNPIFLNNEVLSKAYQREVVNQIETFGEDNLRFWLSNYVEKDQEHYLIFYVQNNYLCAEAVMHIDQNNTAFAEIIKTKGKGRFNSEFRGVTFDITENDETQFLLHYTGHESIID